MGSVADSSTSASDSLAMAKEAAEQETKTDTSPVTPTKVSKSFCLVRLGSLASPFYGMTMRLPQKRLAG
jgi:hypothetical protein